GFCVLFFFFFQAEDGIRDLYVTGVQTCALPICPDQLYRFDVPVVREDGSVVATVPGCLVEPAAEQPAGDDARFTLAAEIFLTSEIGRASCRERVEIWEDGVGLKKRKERAGGHEW